MRPRLHSPDSSPFAAMYTMGHSPPNHPMSRRHQDHLQQKIHPISTKIHNKIHQDPHQDPPRSTQNPPRHSCVIFATTQRSAEAEQASGFARTAPWAARRRWFGQNPGCGTSHCIGHHMLPGEFPRAIGQNPGCGTSHCIGGSWMRCALILLIFFLPPRSWNRYK